MTNQDLFFLLALQRVEGVGDIVAKKLLQHLGSAEAVFKAKPQQLAAIDGIGATLIKNLKDPTVFSKAQAELEYLLNNQINVSFFQDKKYPESLKQCVDGPLLLFSTGEQDWTNKKMISIVGTRQITAYGTEFCKQFISDLAPLNPVIISGFAYGVDIVAHQAAMDHGLQTIGVLAHGMQHIYPKNHKKYMVKMEQNGGFISEFWSSTPPDKENFVRRNRIVAGMAQATIVIESAERGGSLITAQIANDYNRDVFAVPGRSTDKYSLGCNNLIKTQKAAMITSAADLIYNLNWDIQTNPKAIQKQLFVALEPDEQKIYDYLLQSGKEMLDSIAIDCQLPTFKLSSLLLNMELKGVIRPLPGKLFEAI